MEFRDRHMTIERDGMCLGFSMTDKGWQQQYLNPETLCMDLKERQASPPFQLAIAGHTTGFCSSMTAGYMSLPRRMNMKEFEREADSVRIGYDDDELQISVDVTHHFFSGVSVMRQETTVTNHSDVPVTITHLSSAWVNGIATDGVRPWHDKNKIRVHYCLQTWEGEGQWRSGSLEDLGVFPVSVHPVTSAFHMSSVGTYSTSRYLPMLVLEDTETGKVWYSQIETAGNWHMEVGYVNDQDINLGSLSLHADAADERFGGWCKTLQPGESFVSAPAAIGCCFGGFEDAVAELTKYRRSALKPSDAWEGECPVCFNDYMNCLWADPTTDKLLSLIDAASSVGTEAFVMDAGWFCDKEASVGSILGDWQPSRDRFGDEGLKGIIDHITSREMIPGLWLEMEVCGYEAKLGTRPDSWFLMRHGERVSDGDRWFLNFTNPEVREYLHSVIDSLVSMGVGFIKNDYNACAGNGDDTNGNSAADGLLTHVRAFYSFLDEVRARYPKLILENCGSGAMRSDYGTLSHFHLQSSSDQEIYSLYPSIICGALAGVLPEQLGVWAYPLPLLFLDRDNPEMLASDVYQAEMADGEQTIFNMINGMCGNLYLSGRIDFADELNKGLIAEAVSLYKKERAHLHSSHPIWPTGFTRINDPDCWASLGLASEDNRRVLLAVWRLGSANECVDIPLKFHPDADKHIRQIYPSDGCGTVYHYSRDDGKLTVKFEKTFQARLFEVMVL